MAAAKAGSLPILMHRELKTSTAVLRTRPNWPSETGRALQPARVTASLTSSANVLDMPEARACLHLDHPGIFRR